MAKKIYESSTITLSAALEQGTPKTARIDFKYFRDGVEVAKHTRTADQGATDAPFTVPRVADDKERYRLKGVVLVDDREVLVKTYIVYPIDATVEAEDEQGPCDDFDFCLVQEDVRSIVHRTDQQGKSALLQLRKAPFRVEARAPYIILDEPVAVGRKRRVRVKKLFRVEILEPTVAGRTCLDLQSNDPSSGLRQYVNLDTAREGQDGLGTSVKFVLGVVGDRPKAAQDRLGVPAARAYVRVKLGKSPTLKGRVRRSAPAPGLQQAGTESFVKVNDGELTAEVCFDQADNTAVFTVELGRHGGDLCEVQVGGTPTREDATMKLQNWRRLYYELKVVDVMGLQDLPATTRTELTRIGETIFLEYVREACHVVPRATLAANTVIAKTFMNDNSGGEFVFLNATLPFDGFTRAKEPRSICMWIGDFLWTRRGAAQLQKTLNHGAQGIYTGDAWWIPRTDVPVIDVDWTADVDPNVVRQRAALAFNDVVAVEDPNEHDQRIITVTNERGTTRQLTFTKGAIGHIRTDLTPAMRWDLEDLISDANDHATLRAHGNTATITISAPNVSARQRSRVANIKAALTNAYNAAADFSSTDHPGIDDHGQPRTGNFGLGGIDVANSRFCILRFNLPAAAATDPGSFVGPPGPNTCPLLLDITFAKHFPIGGGAVKDAPDAYITLRELTANFPRDDLKTARVIAHELGHKMGMSPHGALAGALAPGLPAAATVDEAEPRYKFKGDQGHVYEAHGHQGPHCAYGLTDDEKALPTYPEELMEDGKPSCIMYGQAGVPADFCDQCLDYFSALELSDIRRSR